MHGTDPALLTHLRVVVLVHTRQGEVLMAKPKQQGTNHKHDWRLPTGQQQAGESIAEAGRRVLHDTTGIKRGITHALLIDQRLASRDGKTAARVDIVLDGGTVDNRQAAALALPEGAREELASLKRVPVFNLESHAPPLHAKLIRMALSAFDHGMRVPLCAEGEPAPA
ncbi:NUDIX domain-containing protein [Streptomyces lasiicapitis]|uniref:Nudix hydrolase domain-containing protein n=1 Tax=Streptomyces lasiicapitis TaxID=1923961 RepID=A0ABQ2LII7_9ACTN|nr:NUDIX domain-containing protein [Streptomyces lasiicapitis]GGO35710.1 hypothetical protein GCM10012286_06760 [Streptomyces lasiicapitis]